MSEDCQAVAVAAAVSRRGRRTSEQRAATFRDQGPAMAVWTAASAHGESDGARREPGTAKGDYGRLWKAIKFPIVARREPRLSSGDYGR